MGALMTVVGFAFLLTVAVRLFLDFDTERESIVEVVGGLEIDLVERIVKLILMNYWSKWKVCHPMST